MDAASANTTALCTSGINGFGVLQVLGNDAAVLKYVSDVLRYDRCTCSILAHSKQNS